MIDLQRMGPIAVLEIQHAKPINPFTRAMTRELIERCQTVEADESIEGVLIWGGEERSFSAGGDFEDLQKIQGQEEGLEYLRDIVRSYQAVLHVTKPLVTAIDFFAIGQGLQVALLGDWRIGSERSKYHMPELANGMPCPLGSALLESFFGRAAMLHMVVGCQVLCADAALEHLLINEIRPHPELKQAALDVLGKLCGYPAYPFRSTKRIHNARLIQLLEDVREEAARAHVASYFGGNADGHFTATLGKVR